MADGLMANPYAGLLNLGLSPEQAQAEVDRQRALQFANLNPQQRMAAGIYGGLTQVSRALGAKDPMLEQASQMRQMAQQFDTTTAQGLLQYAQALQQSGNVQGAQAAAMQARQMMEQEAKTAKVRQEAVAGEAKNIVAAGLADRCEIQVSYAIGVAEPTSVSINTFGTGKISDEKIIELVRETFDLRPYAITNMLDLLHPMYRQTAAYGHFGRDPFEMTVGDDTFTAFPWEKTDKADALKSAAGV